MSLDEKLINLVRQYPILYDISDQHYYDCVMKENAWEEISAALKETVDAMKNRWTSLRDCFRKALNKRKTTSGQKSKSTRPWKYEEEMSFLKAHFGDQRKQKSNLQVASDESDLENDNICEENRTISNREQIITSQMEGETTTQYQSVVASNLLSGNSLTPVSVVKKRKSPEQPTAAHVLQTYFDNKKCEKKRMFPPTSDHLKSFFRAIEDAVRTFSLLQQVEVKFQISSLVSKIEISNQQPRCASRHPCALGKSSTSFPNSPSTQQNVQSSSPSSTQNLRDPLEISPSSTPNFSFPSHSVSQPIIQLDSAGSAQDQYCLLSATSIHNSQMNHSDSAQYSSHLLTPYPASEENCNVMPEMSSQHLSGNDFYKLHPFSKQLKMEFRGEKD